MTAPPRHTRLARTTDPRASALRCPECGAQALNRRSLGIHRAKAHGKRARRLYSWNAA